MRKRWWTWIRECLANQAISFFCGPSHHHDQWKKARINERTQQMERPFNSTPTFLIRRGPPTEQLLSDWKRPKNAHIIRAGLVCCKVGNRTNAHGLHAHIHGHWQGAVYFACNGMICGPYVNERESNFGEEKAGNEVVWMGNEANRSGWSRHVLLLKN